jgi:hypothetical protein
MMSETTPSQAAISAVLSLAAHLEGAEQECLHFRNGLARERREVERLRIALALAEAVTETTPTGEEVCDLCVGQAYGGPWNEPCDNCAGRGTMPTYDTAPNTTQVDVEVDLLTEEGLRRALLKERARSDGLKTALERIARDSNEPWARDFARLAISSDRMSHPDA